ncbi:UPF0400 protein [Neolecta irregularis DAH-3]|uniref:UPF0400 protein n=1 Tax=Neolecta irregularis (strain DAH-3) TaxID=1198029 RepID=A0A1U7LJS5_NEOID|nr:UPF0400 protein [Neolecta irregularis DAH-3]|eukprot:OLL22843.1 UPF0400 protein [Neolecta irregularis DAH-3]
MSANFSADLVTSKLSNLNDTQEGITSVAQWILFHRRHANAIVPVWMQCLQEASSSRKLNLMYLANEVAQQSKARKRDDFINAFNPEVIVTAMETVFRQGSNDLQGKVKRVVDVWRQRQVFPADTLQRIDETIALMDKGKGNGAVYGTLPRTSLPTLPMPPELTKLVKAQQNLTASMSSNTLAISTASRAFSDIIESEQMPNPPVLAHKLQNLINSLGEAFKAATAAVSTREELVNQLTQLLDANKGALEAERLQLKDVQAKQFRATTLLQEVEEMIRSEIPDSPISPRLKSTNSSQDKPMVFTMEENGDDDDGFADMIRPEAFQLDEVDLTSIDRLNGIDQVDG